MHIPDVRDKPSVPLEISKDVVVDDIEANDSVAPLRRRLHHLPFENDELPVSSTRQASLDQATRSRKSSLAVPHSDSDTNPSGGDSDNDGNARPLYSSRKARAAASDTSDSGSSDNNPQDEGSTYVAMLCLY